MKLESRSVAAEEVKGYSLKRKDCPYTKDIDIPAVSWDASPSREPDSSASRPDLYPAETLSMSPQDMPIMVEAMKLVDEAAFPREDLQDDEPVPVPLENVRLAAAFLIVAVARHVGPTNPKFKLPKVAVLHDGRLSLRWRDGDKSVTVFVPPTKAGSYVIVKSKKGSRPERLVQPIGTVKYHVGALLFRSDEN